MNCSSRYEALLVHCPAPSNGPERACRADPGRGAEAPLAAAEGTARHSAGASGCETPAFDPAALGLNNAGKGDPILAAADDLLAGRLRIFGREIALPRQGRDWFLEPECDIFAPSEAYAFDIDARDPAVVGNHKFLFEPSRLQHASLLAAAYALSARDAYAELAAQQLQSWWRANPFLTGVHWTSGIEVGLRLVSFAWTRRLLDGWAGVGDCFEDSALARDQIYRHQLYLAALRSHGSSANNHLLAELLGLYVGATAFPWFPESRRWRESAARELEAEAARQVFPDGLEPRAGQRLSWLRASRCL